MPSLEFLLLLGTQLLHFHLFAPKRFRVWSGNEFRRVVKKRGQRVALLQSEPFQRVCQLVGNVKQFAVGILIGTMKHGDIVG
jgi:hypothetical protein